MESQRRMRRMLVRLSARMESFAKVRRADGEGRSFAAAAIRSIQRVVEYPSTMPEPGVGSMRPVRAKVRAKASVMAESSQVMAQKRKAMAIWTMRARRTRERGAQRASGEQTLEDCERSMAMWASVGAGTSFRCACRDETVDWAENY